MTLKDYIMKRNGVPLGSPKSLRNNLHRSFGARNFTIFWHYWNPIFGYYLGRFVFKPLKRIFPAAIAVLLTFVFCGMLHDAITTLLRGSLAFFFSIWFFYMGLAVVATTFLKINFSSKAWLVRAAANASLIGLCLLAASHTNRLLKAAL